MLKQHEALDLSLRDMLDLFRRCEQIADTIKRGRTNRGRYGTVDALLKQTDEFVAEVRRLQGSVAAAERTAET